MPVLRDMLAAGPVAQRTFALVVLLALVTHLAACSGGGDDDETAPNPVVWGRLRRDFNNSGLASGSIGRNPGHLRWSVSLGDEEGSGGSEPVVGLNNVIYVGTQRGLMAIDRIVGPERTYEIEQCDAPCGGANCSPPPIDIGPVNGTPAVTLNNDILVGNDAGYLFLVHDDGTELECTWAYKSAPSVGNQWVRSSPIAVVDPFDFRLTRLVLGLPAGRIQALNGNGTEQWGFQSSNPAFGPVTSSASTDGVSLFITAPDGYLYSTDSTGQQRWREAVGAPQPDAPKLASPALGVSVYVVAASEVCAPETVCEVPNHLVAFSPNGAFRWRFNPELDGTPVSVPGSPALVLQSVDERIPETPPIATPTPAPEPTATRVAPILQEVVYAVDSTGTVYALKGSNGQEFVLFQPAVTSTPTPTTTPGPDRTPPGTKSSIVQLQTAGVSTSPTISADLFVVFGSVDGKLFALRTDFDRTGPCSFAVEECADEQWLPAFDRDDEPAGRFVEVSPGSSIRSSPVIDTDGTIFVIDTSGNLNAIGVPLQ